MSFEPRSLRVPVSPELVAQAARLELLEFHLRQIATGRADDPQVQARVALGELPIGALLHHADGGLVGRPMTGCSS